MAVDSASVSAGEKKHRWLTNRKKMAARCVREAKMLIATQGQGDVLAALGLLEEALAVAPRMEVALELKARCFLHLRRFKDVAEMLREYIPSVRMEPSDDSSSSAVSENSATLLCANGGAADLNETTFKCFSVSDLKKAAMAGLRRNIEEEGLWRYSVLGQACYQLGLIEDALVLLQTGKRLATAASRRESVSLSDDTFTFNKLPLPGDNLCKSQQAHRKTESESASQLLCQIKLLIRRKTAAMAALDAGLHSEAIRHFSKILDGRRGAPQGFLSECYVHRAVAFQSAGRLAEAIADCNRSLALDTSSIEALSIRASLFEAIRCLPDSLHDLEHLKLLYNSISRDKRSPGGPGPLRKRRNVQYREIPGKLCSLASRIQQLKQRVAAGESGGVDYYALIGLKRGCSRSEVERAHLLLILRHKPDKSSGFIEKCEFSDGKEVDSVRERARLSALSLYRLIQKAHSCVMATISEEEAAENVKKRRTKAAVAPQTVLIQVPSASKLVHPIPDSAAGGGNSRKTVTTPPSSAFQGVFCRDLSAVGNLLSQAGFNRPIAVKYEALSC